MSLGWQAGRYVRQGKNIQSWICNFTASSLACGLSATGWSIGAIVGILIGGAFVTFLNWRYIFFSNPPIGIIATLVGYIMLQNKQQTTTATNNFIIIILAV